MKIARLISDAVLGIISPADQKELDKWLVGAESHRELYEYLVEGGVIVRVRHIPPRLSCGLRITVGTREENDLLIERLKKFGDL